MKSSIIETKPLKIQEWAYEDRPREKLILKGKASLSDAELIAILIGSGTRSLSAVEVGKLILSKCANDLNKLAKMDIKDLKKIKGIGEAKAISVISAMELGRRRKDVESKNTKISNSRDAYELMNSYLMDLPHEEFWVILLNRANDVISVKQISKGGVAGTVVDSKIIFKYAFEEVASSIILVHNHPSGNIQPSSADLEITRKIKSAGNLLDINVVDHIIYTNNQYFSFADEGKL